MSITPSFVPERDSAFIKAGARGKISIAKMLIGCILLLTVTIIIAYSVCLVLLPGNCEDLMLKGSMPGTMKLAAQVMEDNMLNPTPETAQTALGALELTENAKFSVVDSTGSIVAGEAVDAPTDAVAKISGTEAGCTSYSNAGTPSVLAYAPIKGTEWSLVMTAPRNDFGSMYGTITIYMICLAVFGLLFAAFGLSLAIPKLTRPFAALIPAIERVSKGDFSGSVPEIGKSYTDFCQLHDSVGILMSNTSMVITDIQNVLGEMSHGNFTIESETPESYVGDYRTIYEAEEQIRNELSGTLAEINDVSAQVNAGSEQLSNGAQTLAQGATEQASSVEELSSTTADVARQIQNSVSMVQDANVLTQEAGEVVKGGMEAMAQAKAAMDEISETSNNISKVIKAIDDIAFQTNILALNAAVEAARAGAAGKGFAVVADEVRNLSQKSAEAAKNSTTLIDSSIAAVEKGGKLVGKASDDFNLVADKTLKINEIVTSITEQFRQQAEATNQISQGIDQVASVIQMNSATSEESAAASQELSGQANVLKDLVSQFQLSENM